MNFRLSYIVFLILVQGFCTLRSEIKIFPKKEESILKDTTLVIPEDFDNSLDYMLQSWIVKKAKPSDCRSSDAVFNITDSIYKRRLSKMPCIMEMPYNPVVKSYIELYTVRKRKQVEYMLGMSNYYFPVFEQALGANNLPLELKNLSIIESALNTTIVSRMGAAGLWQLMINTAKMYGLEVNSLVDERLQPSKATNAAARFLKDLYSIYGDWSLVIAAYNCGPGNVNRAIRKAGGKKDYWAIYPYLPRETRGYVPIFIAANYTMHYPKEHNLCSATLNLPAMTDTVMIKQRLHLNQVASILDLPIEQVRFLNPQYKMDIIPGDIKPYPVCLPMKEINTFNQKWEQVVNYKADELVKNRRDEIALPTIVKQPQSDLEIKRGKHDKHSKKEKRNRRGRKHSSDESSSNSDNPGKLTIKVKRGQTLSQISARYGVSMSKLKQMNKLNGSAVRAGSRLKVYK